MPHSQMALRPTHVTSMMAAEPGTQGQRSCPRPLPWRKRPGPQDKTSLPARWRDMTSGTVRSRRLAVSLPIPTAGGIPAGQWAAWPRPEPRPSVLALARTSLPTRLESPVHLPAESGRLKRTALRPNVSIPEKPERPALMLPSWPAAASPVHDASLKQSGEGSLLHTAVDKAMQTPRVRDSVVTSTLPAPISNRTPVAVVAILPLTQ